MEDLTSGLAIGILFAAPWIVAIVWALHRQPEDGVPPSLGETLRKRLGIH